MIRTQGGVSIEHDFVAFTFFLQQEQLYLFSPVKRSTSRNCFMQSWRVKPWAERRLGIDRVSEQFSVYVLD